MSRSLGSLSLVALSLFLASGCTTESTPGGPPAPAPALAADPLPSWNEGATRKSIVDFVGRITREDGPDFVPPPERIATFDNDGTLWSETPVPFQVVFAFDRVKALAPQHPEWKMREPFASLLKGDMAGIAAAGEKGVLAVMAAIHTGMTTDEFSAQVQEWIATAKHPATGRLFTELQMLQWATAGARTRLALFVHHDDEAREFAYDRADKMQQFDKGWDEAVARGWTAVSMRDDWNTVFPPASGR